MGAFQRIRGSIQTNTVSYSLNLRVDPCGEDKTLQMGKNVWHFNLMCYKVPKNFVTVNLVGGFILGGLARCYLKRVEESFYQRTPQPGFFGVRTIDISEFSEREH